MNFQRIRQLVIVFIAILAMLMGVGVVLTFELRLLATLAIPRAYH